MNEDTLVDELRGLGSSLDVPAPDPEASAAAVLQRLAEDDVPAASRAGGFVAVVRRYRVRIAAALLALLVALTLTPPVRATVAEWFGFAGVIVRPGPSEPSAPAPPPGDAGLSLSAARELVAFEPVLPDVLGTPDGVDVTSERRLMTLTWHDGDETVRLDQFDGRLSPLFMKTAQMNDTAERIDLGAGEAYWFSEPHDLVLLDDGRERTEPPRVAAPTLVWQAGDVTLRLEGLDRQEAIAIAESVPRAGTG